MLSPVCQLLERNLDLFETGRWGIFNPDNANVFSLSSSFVCGFHQDFAIYQQSSHFQAQQFFAADFELNQPDTLLDGIVIFMPKAKELLELLLLNAIAILGANTKIIVIGEHTSGVKSAPRIMQNSLSDVQKHDYARRCSLFIGSCDVANSHYEFMAYRRIHDNNVAGEAVKTITTPGVFGHKKLDEGTRLLLENLPDLQLNNAKNTVLDFACGSGLIGAYLKKRYPSVKVLFSDVNALALNATKETLNANGLDGEVIASDGLSNVEHKLDAIVCNPPFHQGTKNNYRITQQFIKDAYQRLKPSGLLILVANRFLPYPDSLQASFGEFDTIYADNRFCVYSALKRK